MSIISQKVIESQERESRIHHFFKRFEIGKLLRKSGAEKEKGISAVEIFKYLICLMFSDRSMYMQLVTGKFVENFCKNTVYRFLNSSKTNWEHFTAILSECIVNKFLRPLTSEKRDDVFIIDDSTYKKTGFKKTELVAKVFDHVSMKYIKGFRMLTLGWSDGCSFIPITHRLMSSSNDKNVFGITKTLDKRSLAYRRRKQAREKAPDIMVDMIKNAQKLGHYAKYVLFDSWFCSPKSIIRIKQDCSLDTIAMVKKSSKIKYVFEVKKLNIKQIFAMCKKKKGRSKYLLSINVTACTNDDKGNQMSIPVKIVCVRNRSNRKDWLAIICTDTELSEEEIIRIYGKRWDIEVFFKTCKSMLRLESGCRCLSYDAITAHVSIVFTRYMLIAVEKRINEDDRTAGEIFFLLCDEVRDISFNQSMSLLVQAFLDSAAEMFKLSDQQLSALVECFLFKLPAYLRGSLLISYVD